MLVTTSLDLGGWYCEMWLCFGRRWEDEKVKGVGIRLFAAGDSSTSLKFYHAVNIRVFSEGALGKAFTYEVLVFMGNFAFKLRGNTQKVWISGSPLIESEYALSDLKALVLYVVFCNVGESHWANRHRN